MFIPEEGMAEVSPTRRRKDLKTIIDIVMHTPLNEQEVVELDESLPVSALKGKNVDVQSAIVLRIASQAVGGDIKSADWLGKYGGLEPPKEQKVSLDMPQFYMGTDMLPEDIRQALAAETATVIAPAEQVEEGEEDIEDAEFTIIHPGEEGFE